MQTAAREDVKMCREVASKAECVLGVQHIVWLRVRQLLIDALHRLAVSGEAATADLVALIQVRVLPAGKTRSRASHG